MANEKRLDLIDRSELAKDIAQIGFVTVGSVLQCLSDAKRVDAVEVVHGRNLDEDTPSLFECSICHWSCNDTYYGDTAEYNYCPNCGAKMDGDGNV